MEENRALSVGLLLLALLLPGGCKPKAGGKKPGTKPESKPAPVYVYPSTPGKKPIYEGPMVVNEPPLVARPASHDFGRIFDSETVSRSFTVTNPAKQAITLIKIDTSCGCTAANPVVGGRAVELPHEIAPGASFTLPVALDPRRRGGKQEQWVELRTNNATQPITRIKITARIVSEVNLESYVFFGRLTRGKRHVRKLTLSGFPAERFEVTGVESTARYVTVKVGPAVKPASPGDPVRHTVEIAIEPDAPYGRIEQDVFIKTNSPRFPRKKVFVLALIRGEVEVRPGRLRLRVTAERPNPLATIFLSSKSLRIQVLSVSCEPGYVKWKLHPRQGNNQSIRIEVGASPGGQRGLVRGRIEIKTNSKERPAISVPLILDYGQAKRD